MAIIPGGVRIRAIAPDDYTFAAGGDTVVEAQQLDGEWVELRGIASASVALWPNKLVTASLVVELTEAEFVTVNSTVTHRAAPWWRRLLWRLRAWR